MKTRIFAYILLLSFAAVGCQEKTDLEKGYECIEEQKKKFGKDYSDADAGPCIGKYWMPKETNTYLK